MPQDAWQVQDADEEIFLLYSELQSSGATSDADPNVSGLGSVDSRQAELFVRIDVQQSPRHDTVMQNEPLRSRASKRCKAASKKRDNDAAKQEPLDIRLFQDTTALRSRKGDTGSVLWRASVHLARLLLSQPSPSNNQLLPTAALSSCHVLELGSGTGLLGIVLSPLVTHYTATDLPALLPLIRKNLEHNLSPQRFNVSIDDIDWIQLHNTPAQFRHNIFPSRNMSNPSSSKLIQDQSAPWTSRRASSPIQLSALGAQRRIDLIIAVDCVYNPSLIAPLLDTIDYLATLNSHIAVQPEPGIEMNVQPLASPAVLVVLELRAADVSRDFLHAWLEMPGRWEIWSVPLLGARFAMWVGRRRGRTSQPFP